MANDENALQAARSLWLASTSVSRSEFNAFARSLDLEDRYAGPQGIGWRSLVTDGEKARVRSPDAVGRRGGLHDPAARPAARLERHPVQLPAAPLEHAGGGRRSGQPGRPGHPRRGP